MSKIVKQRCQKIQRNLISSTFTGLHRQFLGPVKGHCPYIFNNLTLNTFIRTLQLHCKIRLLSWLLWCLSTVICSEYIVTKWLRGKWKVENEDWKIAFSILNSTISLITGMAYALQGVQGVYICWPICTIFGINYTEIIRNTEVIDLLNIVEIGHFSHFRSLHHSFGTHCHPLSKHLLLCLPSVNVWKHFFFASLFLTLCSDHTTPSCLVVYAIVLLF